VTNFIGNTGLQTPIERACLSGLFALGLMVSATGVHAAPIFWTDWTTDDSSSTTAAGDFVGKGTITTSTSTVDVTYTNPQGIHFFDVGGGTDYWQNNPTGVAVTGATGRDTSDSPFTSTPVDNIPTGTDIIALNHAGTQTLTFSEAIANPVFSYVSLNGNGYAFDQDFDILSFGDSSDGNDCGYWGCGTSSKSIVSSGGGTEYQLLGTGEPHGTIRFTGAFDTVSWRSLSNETWNGFTVGVEGTEIEVLVPEPVTLALLALGLVGIGARRRPIH